MMKPDKAANAHMRIEGGKSKASDVYPRQNYPLIVSVASGKGGVGKTLTIVNMALSACQSGRRVLILDGDLGLANVDIVLGLQPKYHIRDVFDGLVSLSEIILEGPCGMKILPSGSGIASLHALSIVQQQILDQQIASLSADFDVLLIDTGAGLGPNVLHLNSLSHRRIIVTTSEPHAMTDAYALIKVLAEQKNLGNFDLVVNMVQSSHEADAVAHRLRDVAERFLKIDVNYLGFVPNDAQVGAAVLRRQAASAAMFQTLAGQAWHKMSSRLLQDYDYRLQGLSLQDFWKNLLKPERNCSVQFISP